jgi:hypothetical protein
MKKTLCTSLLALVCGVAGAAPIGTHVLAQADDAQGITMSTDPAKAAEVERQAAQLRAAQETGTSGTSAPAHKARSHRHPAHHAHHHAKDSGSTAK